MATHQHQWLHGRPEVWPWDSGRAEGPLPLGTGPLCGSGTPCRRWAPVCSSWAVRCCSWKLQTTEFASSQSSCGSHNTWATERNKAWFSETVANLIIRITSICSSGYRRKRECECCHLSLHVVDSTARGIAVGSIVFIVHALDWTVHVFFNLATNVILCVNRFDKIRTDA